MSDYSCYLITLLYGNELIRCALRIKNTDIPFAVAESPDENKEFFHSKLPLHVRECGPVVEIEPIFEVVEDE